MSERKTVYWVRPRDGQMVKASVPIEARPMAIGAYCLECMPSEDATPVVEIVDIDWKAKTYRCAKDEHEMPVLMTMLKHHMVPSLSDGSTEVVDTITVIDREGYIRQISEGMPCNVSDETRGPQPPGGSPARGGVG